MRAGGLVRARLVSLSVLVAIALVPGGASAAQASSTAMPSTQLSADLDGRAIALVDVSNWYCEDLAYPQIHCFSDPTALERTVATLSATSALSATSTVAYVVVFENASYQGPYMYFSEDYWSLGLIGWNDRISSFIPLNSQSGVFWTDWLYSGTRYSFCCNQGVSYVGNAYNDTFSSVFRN